MLYSEKSKSPNALHQHGSLLEMAECTYAHNTYIYTSYQYTCGQGIVGKVLSGDAWKGEGNRRVLGKKPGKVVDPASPHLLSWEQGSVGGTLSCPTSKQGNQSSLEPVFCHQLGAAPWLATTSSQTLLDEADHLGPG